MAVDFVTLVGGDTYDPCLLLKALRPIYYELLTATSERRVQYRDRDVWFQKADTTALLAVIRQLEIECPAANAARGRRGAVRGIVGCRS